MARVSVWSDEWVRQLPHPANGETVFHDPQVSGHRLVISKTKKVFEIQRDRPSRLYFTGSAYATEWKGGATNALSYGNFRFIASTRLREPHPNDRSTWHPSVKRLSCPSFHPGGL